MLVGADCVGTAGGQGGIVRINAKHFAQRDAEGLRIAIGGDVAGAGVVGVPAVAGAEIEISVGPESDRAAVVIGGVLAQGEDFPRWYQDVVAKAQLAENGPVRGTMVIRPWAYGIWELLQRSLDERIKASGARNAYCRRLIPESYLRREAEHVEGFSPELAVVTVGGGKDLAEPAVIRPTSETIINACLARWISSYRGLPLKVRNHMRNM